MQADPRKKELFFRRLHGTVLSMVQQGFEYLVVITKAKFRYEAKHYLFTYNFPGKEENPLL